MVLMYVTFMFIIIYGVRVMRSVLEEKNNRVVEIIISSVKPFELMMGKILGVTLVALTQFLIWISMSVIGALVLNTGFSPIQKGIPVEMKKLPASWIWDNLLLRFLTVYWN
jgi:ABC-2 type transport system permease protein